MLDDWRDRLVDEHACMVRAVRRKWRLDLMGRVRIQCSFALPPQLNVVTEFQVNCCISAIHAYAMIIAVKTSGIFLSCDILDAPKEQNSLVKRNGLILLRYKRDGA